MSFLTKKGRWIYLFHTHEIYKFLRQEGDAPCNLCQRPCEHLSVCFFARRFPPGHSHMLVDIKCLSIDPPFFLNRPYTQWPPFFIQSTPNDPLFSLLYQILHKNCKFLRASRAFWEILRFCGNLNRKCANSALKLHFCTLNDPHFWEPTPKKAPIFLVPTSNDPLIFDEILHRTPPIFVSGIGTGTSLSYLSAPGDSPPPPFLNRLMPLAGIYVFHLPLPLL